MKKIYILRHAEAVSGYDDFNRILSSNGYRQALTIGKKLAEENHKIDKIIASAAIRTLTTSEIVAEQIGFDKAQIETFQELYNATIRIWLNLIHSIDENTKNVLLVGHNPHISYLVELLSGEAFEGLGTAYLALLETDKKWQEIDKQTAKLLKVLKPA
jgi:phosphohistidine phosphatase